MPAASIALAMSGWAISAQGAVPASIVSVALARLGDHAAFGDHRRGVAPGVADVVRHVGDLWSVMPAPIAGIGA